MGRQIAGTHYEEMPIQPWDIIKAHDLDYWAGTVVKYVLRAGKKDGVPKSTDLKKAADFLREYIQLTEDQENEQLLKTAALTKPPAAEQTLPVVTYRCPNGHDVPAQNRNRFAEHQATRLGSICEFSGAYVGVTTERAHREGIYVTKKLPYGAVGFNQEDEFRCGGCGRWISESANTPGKLASHHIRIIIGAGVVPWCTFGTGAVFTGH